MRSLLGGFFSVLGQLASEIPMVKFFVTALPELRVYKPIRLTPSEDKNTATVLFLHDLNPTEVASDVELIFDRALHNIALRHGLDDWPTKEQLDLLCQRTAGLFMYAAATIKFIDKKGANPRERLNLLLQSPESSGLEAKTKFKGNTTIDSLYALILQGAFGGHRNLPKVRSVLGAMVVAACPLSTSTIAILSDLDHPMEVFSILESLQPVLILPPDNNSPVQPFHKSFHHFIIDPDRCKNKRFHVSPPAHHSELLFGCLRLMNRKLEKNMCKLPDGVANSDVNDLKQRVERCIDPALQYACRSWHTHLVTGYTMSVHAVEITSDFCRFFETKFLFWLEVLSVLGVVRNAVDALQVALDRLEVRLHLTLSVSLKYAQTWFRKDPRLTSLTTVPASYPATLRSSPHPLYVSISWRPPTFSRQHPPHRTAVRV